jgi:hypothetical protein
VETSQSRAFIWLQFDPVHGELIEALGVNDLGKLLTNESLALHRALAELAVSYQNPTIGPQGRAEMHETAEAVP